MAHYTLHQSIFGYSNGHRLLATSKRLSPETERLMLRLTDLSGSRLIEGFETYYCGYPLLSGSGYAFSKTWYADEMDRPGSVWTHVLILDQSTMEQLSTLYQLLPFFERPKSQRTFDNYGRTVSVPFDGSGFVSPLTTLNNGFLTLALVGSLYGQDQPVVLEAVNADEFSSLPFHMWSQQPPLARSRFKFCTGALDALRYGDEPFTLQIMPQRIARLLPDSFSIISPTMRSAETWAMTLAKDLPEEGNTPLRSFLRDYFDIESQQSTFWPAAQNIQKLTKVFIELEGNREEERLPEIVRLVAQEFPTPQAGSSLKRALFGSTSLQYAWIHFAKSRTLRCLANQLNAPAFDPEALDLYSQASSIWREDNAAAAKLFVDLLKEAVTPTSEKILEGLISGISLQDVLQTATILGLPGISTIAERSTILVTNPDFWKLQLSWEWHSEIAEGLSASGQTRAVLLGILAAGRNDLLLRLLRSAPSTVAPALLETIDADGKVSSIPGIPLSQVADTLVPYAEDVRRWIKKHSYHLTTRSLALITFVLRPDEPTLLSDTTVDNWKAVLQEPQLSHAKTHLTSFILALALQNISQRGFELAEQTFQEVHSAAAEQRIGYENWSLVRPFVPELSWYINWDKCERLRRGLCVAYLKYLWPPASLLNCVCNERDLRNLLASCEAVDGGKTLIDTILRTMYEQPLPEFKRTILEKISRNWR